jgi:hypothetical protein
MRSHREAADGRQQGFPREQQDAPPLLAEPAYRFWLEGSASSAACLRQDLWIIDKLGIEKSEESSRGRRSLA